LPARWQFIWASPSIGTLPPEASLEGGLPAFQRRQIRLITRLTGRNALARTSHYAGPHPGTGFLEGSSDTSTLRLVDIAGLLVTPRRQKQKSRQTALIHKSCRAASTLARATVVIAARHGLKDSTRTC